VYGVEKARRSWQQSVNEELLVIARERREPLLQVRLHLRSSREHDGA